MEKSLLIKIGFIGWKIPTRNILIKKHWNDWTSALSENQFVSQFFDLELRTRNKKK